MPDIASILAQAEDPSHARTATARVLLRQELLSDHAELDAELSAAIERDRQLNAPDAAPAIAQQIRDLEAEIDTAKVEFRFRAVGHRAWADLMAKHPPTSEQRKAFPRIDHNPETFPIAALAASCAEPEMTVDDVKRLERVLNESQFAQMWTACLKANAGGDDDPKSLAAGAIARLKGASGITAAREESLAASSSDE